MSLRQKFGKALFNGNATTLASRAAPGQGAVVNYTQQRNIISSKVIQTTI